MLKFFIVSGKTDFSSTQYWDSVAASELNKYTFVMEDETSMVVGVSAFYRLDDQNKTAYTGTIVGPPYRWGAGYGQKIKRWQLNYAFNRLRLNALLSEVLENNTRMLRLLYNLDYCKVSPIGQLQHENNNCVLLRIDRLKWGAPSIDI
jgi:RimJ/RimL family protein N-acetyltransferase